jgi:lysophospholipase L1-like esterase
MTQAERFLPRSLAKLRQGESLKLLAWGDSVTAMGEHDPKHIYYQNVFAEELKLRFPKAAITLHTAAWPGSLSGMWFETDSAAPHNFQRDCLEFKPDLVTIEFVNDAQLDHAQTEEQYKHIIQEFHKIGSEVILITPHYIRADWMGATTMKLDDDPRPYVKALREFAAVNDIALADASKYWGRLWRQGIPYIVYLPNSINHPDARGHAIFVKSLMELFPAK